MPLCELYIGSNIPTYRPRKEPILFTFRQLEIDTLARKLSLLAIRLRGPLGLCPRQKNIGRNYVRLMHFDENRAGDPQATGDAVIENLPVSVFLRESDIPRKCSGSNPVFRIFVLNAVAQNVGEGEE